MTPEPRPEDWTLLGLEPGASAAEVHSAYQQRMTLYAPSSLATYMLLEPNERTELLHRLEAAYRRLAASLQTTRPTPPPPVRAVRDADIEPAGPEPDPARSPGAYLRHHRLQRGLSLEQVAHETKIRAAVIAQIEDEDVTALPAPVYVRGFVLQIAGALHLANGDDLARLLLERLPRPS